MNKALVKPPIAAAAAAAVHPLNADIEVFCAGTHTDASGKTNTFTEADLDSMVANHAVQAAPAVIGHPKHDDPAVGWVAALKRVGSKLFASFKDWHPEFVAAVDAGSYRNRSVALAPAEGGGWRICHVGFLGAMLPAVKGMQALAYTAPADTLTFVAPYESPAMQTALGFEGMAEILRNLREQTIADKGLDAANDLIPSWRIDSLIEHAAILRKDPQATPINATPHYQAGDPSMTITPEQLKAAEDAAAEKATEAAKLAFAEQGAQERTELAQLKAKVQLDQINATLDKWMDPNKPLITKAERDGAAEFMSHLQQAEGKFTFSQGGGEVVKTPYQWFTEFVSKRSAVLPVGQSGAGAPGTPEAPFADPVAASRAAQNYVAAQAKLGVTVNFLDAIDKVKAGEVPL